MSLSYVAESSLRVTFLLYYRINIRRHYYLNRTFNLHKPMKKLSRIGTVLGAFFILTLVASPLAAVEASKGENRGNHYGWYKQEWKKNKFENRGYFPLYSYGSIDNLEAYIAELQTLLKLLQSQSGGGSYSNNLNVTTKEATNVTEDSVTLRGYLDFGNDDEAEVYFEYGTTRTNLNKTTSSDELEDTDTIFSETISGLKEDTLYYFRAVAKDEDGNRDYGAILSFYTDGTRSSDDEPTTVTKSASDVEDTDAELNGTVTMNDFSNGRVFFVYGTDEDSIEDVTDENEYSDINEDGDNLMKTEVDADLDGSSSYILNIGNLDEDTTYYFRIAVEYEDEDNDSEIEFGSVKSFTTTD